MLSLNKILVIIEPEADSQLALDKALRLAGKSGAALELLIADHSTYLEDGYYFDPVQAADLRKEHLARHRQMLDGMADVIRARGFTVSVDVLWGNPPWEQVLNKVMDSAPDLLVQSTRHHEKIARLLLSHQDWQLLRYCPCPLLLVKDEPWQKSPVVLVSVDPTHANDKPAELDERLVEMGNTVAGLTGGTVHVFHSCYQAPVSGIYSVKVDESGYREATARLLQPHDIPDSRLHLSDEEIQESLPAKADEISADVIVMGVISRSRLDRLFVGNTAEKLLDRLHQDVLVLKPEGFRDTVKKARL